MTSPRGFAASSAERAARSASKPSSGNLESITSGAGVFGNRMTQSGRLPLESVAWNS